MWEAVATPGRGRDLAAWARDTMKDSEVYVSADDRVVVVGTAVAPDPPAALVSRAPHVWEFERFT